MARPEEGAGQNDKTHSAFHKRGVDKPCCPGGRHWLTLTIVKKSTGSAGFDVY